jgi:hypothetical protein
MPPLVLFIISMIKTISIFRAVFNNLYPITKRYIFGKIMTSSRCVVQDCSNVAGPGISIHTCPSNRQDKMGEFCTNTPCKFCSREKLCSMLRTLRAWIFSSIPTCFWLYKKIKERKLSSYLENCIKGFLGKRKAPGKTRFGMFHLQIQCEI